MNVLIHFYIGEHIASDIEEYADKMGFSGMYSDMYDPYLNGDGMTNIDPNIRGRYYEFELSTSPSIDVYYAVLCAIQITKTCYVVLV